MIQDGIEAMQKIAADGPLRPAEMLISCDSSPLETAPVAELRAIDAIDDMVQAYWQILAEHAAEPNIFYEPALLIPGLAQFCSDARTRLFLLWQGAPGASPLLGLLPLGPRWQFGRWPVPFVQNWLHANAFLGTPLVVAGFEKVFWEALLRTADAADWSGFLHLNAMTVDGPLDRALRAVCAEQHRPCDLVHSEARALLTGTGDPDAYLEASLRGKKRKELRRQKRRLEEEGELAFSRHADDRDLDAWIADFLSLEAKGWKGEARSALASEAATAEFFRDAMRRSAAAGRLERLDYRLDGQPLAMLANFLCPPGSFSFKTTFDENYARYSPGVLLQLENLKILRRDDIAWMDSCAAQDHPMIDHIWTGRRHIGRFSIALRGVASRTLFNGVRFGETMMARLKGREIVDIAQPGGPA